MNHIHRNKGYKPEMLADGPVRELITATCDTLTEPLHNIGLRQEVPPELTAAIDENTFYFSGFKTHHELVEASRLLKGDDGNFKPFEQFRRDVEAIDSTYNRNYLQAEYNFAAAASQMAVKWKEWEQDGDDYDLQYRTAGDDRVREEHAALDGVTLPPSDPFWNSYLPPNGWNCRCTTVQVRKGKYPQSDPEEAAARGAACTARPKQQIFRFNPGKQQKIFPPKHPYFPKGCGDCSYKRLAEGKNSSNCKACRTLGGIEKQREEREATSTARNNAINSISDGTFKNELLGLENIETGFLYKSRKSVKNLLHHSINVAEIETAMSLIDHLDKLEFVRNSYLGEGKNLKDPIEQQKIQKKIDRGIIGYNIYYYKYNGRRWCVKTEVSYRGDETLYSFTKKP